MKKFIGLLLFVFLSFSCLTENTVIVDTWKYIKIYEVNLIPMSVSHDTINDKYIWETMFFEKYTRQVLPAICYMTNANSDIESIIKSGNYKIKAKLILNIYNGQMNIYPVWKYSNRKVTLQIEEMKILDYKGSL